MQHRFTTTSIARLAQLCLTVLVLSPCLKASASGFAVPALGPTNMGVSTPGPLSVHLNPAGLGFAEQPRFIVGGDLLIGHISYRRNYRATYQRPDSLDFNLPIDPDAVDPDKSGFVDQVSTTPVGLVPSAFAEVPLPGVPLALGFGVDVPYAAIVHWPGEGPQRFALDDATVASVFLNAGVAYRPIKRLSIGAGVSYVVGYASLSRVQDLATVQELGDALARPPISQPNGFGPDADPALRELNTFARRFDFKNGWAHGVTFRGGLMAEPIDNLYVSASYEHTTSLHFRGDFTLDMNDPFFTQDLASQGLQYPALVGGDASLSFTLPRVVRAGISYAFGHNLRGKPRSSVALEGTYSGFPSRIIQHEYDHLEGVLLVDRMSSSDRLRNKAALAELVADFKRGAAGSPK